MTRDERIKAISDILHEHILHFEEQECHGGGFEKSKSKLAMAIEEAISLNYKGIAKCLEDKGGRLYSDITKNASGGSLPMGILADTLNKDIITIKGEQK